MLILSGMKLISKGSSRAVHLDLEETEFVKKFKLLKIPPPKSVGYKFSQLWHMDENLIHQI